MAFNWQKKRHRLSILRNSSFFWEIFNYYAWYIDNISDILASIASNAWKRSKMEVGFATGMSLGEKKKSLLEFQQIASPFQSKQESHRRLWCFSIWNRGSIVPHYGRRIGEANCLHVIDTWWIKAMPKLTSRQQLWFSVIKNFISIFIWLAVQIIYRL